MFAQKSSLRDVLTQCDRVFSSALSLILATATGCIGFDLSPSRAGASAEPVAREIVRYVSVPSAPVVISIDAARGDAPRAALLAEYNCLAQVMYYEARGEGEGGEKAVAEVVFHRLEGGAHGKSICAVVYEGAGHAGCQFSFVCDGSMDRPKEIAAWQSAERLSARILSGSQPLSDITDGATNYHAVYVRPAWSAELVRTAQIGNHIFYRTSGGEALVLQERAFRGSIW